MADNNNHMLAKDSLLQGRASGVLLHLSSLPSGHGIGDMGAAAYTFADRLVAAGQKYWQILPLNPSNPVSGESPYFSSSAFAGNPLLIDLLALQHEGLLAAEECLPPDGLPSTAVDFDRVRAFKLQCLATAAQRFQQRGLPEDFYQFCNEHRFWLQDYCLFTLIQGLHPGQSWCEWPQSLRDRDPDALAAQSAEHEQALILERIIQYFFFRQWQQLKDYCNRKGLVIFGDMPIYVSYESADVWANTRYFKLDGDCRPTMVSGVPPDYFSATGQLWNNPVYNWEALQADNFQWWLQRMGALFERFDIVRIDHFRGLVQFWEVPAGEPTAIHGEWQPVPTYPFFDALKAAFPHFPVVVEDLGIITPDVVEVKDHYQLPGMLILQFAFGDDDTNPYLPANHIANALVYLGSHDNTTGRHWLAQLDAQSRRRLRDCLPQTGEPGVEDVIALVLSSVADIAIVTAQDVLNLDGSARMNDPAVMTGNWKWRLSDEQLNALTLEHLAQLTRETGRWYGD